MIPSSRSASQSFTLTTHRGSPFRSAAVEKPGAPKDYQSIKLDKADLTHLEAFLKLLDDVEDKNFRELIIQAKVLDTSQN